MQKNNFLSIQTTNDVGLDAVWKSTYSPSTFDEFIGCVREGVAGMIRDVLAGKKEMAKDQKGRERKLCWHSGVCMCVIISLQLVGNEFRLTFTAFSSILSLADSSAASELSNCSGPVDFARSFWTVEYTAAYGVHNSNCSRPASTVTYPVWHSNVCLVYPVLCFTFRYQVSHLQQPQPLMEEGKAVVYIYFNSMEVAFKEERQLLDFPALVYI